MVTINLKDCYPWYTHDEYICVSDEVAEELLADKRYEKAHRRRIYRNKAQYSLDAGDGIENEACLSAPSPDEVIERRQTICCLCEALESLPETQARRIEAHYIHGRSVSDIAKAEGVVKSSVSESISRGLEVLKKYFENIHEQPEQSASK